MARRKFINVRVNEKEYHNFEKTSNKLDISKGELIRRMFNAYLNKEYKL